MSLSSVCPVCRAELDPIEAGRCARCAVIRNSPPQADKRRKRKAATPSRSQHTETEKDDLEPESAEEEEDSRRAEEKPSRHSKDPLRGFFLQTILECRECPDRPARRFSFFTSWQLHLRTHHPHLGNIANYRREHGDPDLVHFKHTCRLCNIELKLNLTVMKRHLALKHNKTVEQYLDLFRTELVEERKGRPIVRPQHTLEGWWEGCLYSCKLCPATHSSQTGFESHLASSHRISGQQQIRAEYLDKFGRLATHSRVHECFVCGKAVRHEYRVIFQHLAKHQMDIEQYTKTYRTQLLGELREKGMDYIISREENAEGSVKLEQYLATSREERDTGETELMEFWYDCSKHRCALCNAEFWSNLKFHWHIKREHGLYSTRDYRRLHGDPEVALRQHECQLCGNMIKWEASRIRDHLKAHKRAEDRLTLKQYGDRFKSYILGEVKRIKGSKDTLPNPNKTSDAGGPEEVSDGELVKNEFSVQEWKDLFVKKVRPDDKLECEICQKKMNRHSFKRHQERAHQGLLNSRDLRRLKRKQVVLANSGVVKSLGQLLKEAGGTAVVVGKGDSKENIDVDKEDPILDQKSRMNLLEAGLSVDEIEQKMELINSGLSICKANAEESIGIEKDTTMKNGDDEIEDISEEEATTYLVDGETGEIIRFEDNAEAHHTDENFETDSVTGPLDGRIMEIDIPPGSCDKTILEDADEDVKIIMLNEEYQSDNEPVEIAVENLDHSFVSQKSDNVNVDNVVVVKGPTMESMQFVVADEEKDSNVNVENTQSNENTETLVSSYIYVCEDGEMVLEQEAFNEEDGNKSATFMTSSKWHQLGPEEDYEPRLVSKPHVEAGGRVSEGTMVCQWTKLAGERVRVSTAKLVTPSSHVTAGPGRGEAADRDIANTFLYSLDTGAPHRVLRDIGCQITPHKVNGVPTNQEEERRQADAIRQFLAGGGVLDRVCPGCDKTMSRVRNLVSHIEIIHGVQVAGPEKEEHLARHTRENVRVTCQQCGKIVSRKSIKRHMNLCHGEIVK